MGYLYISIASILFSTQFAFTKQYQRRAGNDLRAIFLTYAVGPIVFLLITLCTEGFQIKVTPFSAIFSAYHLISAFLMGYCSIKALASGSLSNYSIFMMSGGMILPCVYGAIWGGDDFGVFKIIGIALILSAVLIKVNFKEKASLKTYLYLVGLFVLNGMAGVVASIYQSDIFPYARPNPQQYSMFNNLLVMGVAWVAFLVCFVVEHRRQKTELGEAYDPQMNKDQLITYAKASPWSMASSLVNNVANLLLMFALLTVQPSVQYPVITGGSIFLSALIGLLFFKEKPDKRTWLSVALVIAGTVFIMF